MTVLNLRFRYHLVLSPTSRNFNFDFIWFIVDKTQNLTVHCDLFYKGLNFQLFLEIIEYI